MPSPPTETNSLRGRLLGSIAAIALLALPSTAAFALPPAVDWHPVSLTANRGDVHITPTFEASGSDDQPSAASVRISNLNPFPVAVHDLIIPRRTPLFDALYAAPQPVELAPFAVEQLRLEATEWIKVDPTDPARRPLPPIRMLLLPTEAHQVDTDDALDDLRRALDVDPTAQLPNATGDPARLDEGWRGLLAASPYEGADRLELLAQLMKQEAALASQADHRAGEVALAHEAVRERLDAIKPLACAFERRLAFRLLDSGQRLGRHLTLYKHGGRLGGFRACAQSDQEFAGALVAEALEADEQGVARDISALFDAGSATPEPFKRALVNIQTQRVQPRLGYEFILSGGDEGSCGRLTSGDGEIDFYELVEVIEGFQSLERLSPNHPLKENLGGVAAALAALSRASAEDGNFRRSGIIMTQLDAVIELLEASDPGEVLESARRARDAAKGEIAWTEGRFIFHYQRGKQGALDEARLRFVEARDHAPVRARLYGVGITLVEHQFKALAGFFLLFGLIWGASRSPQAARLWLRLLRRAAMARARRRPHEGSAVAWRLMTRMLALSGARPADEALRALVAADLVDVARQVGDAHLLQEAAGHLHRVEAALRPPAWRTPRAALEEIARDLDGGAEAAAADRAAAAVGGALGSINGSAAGAIEAQAALLAQIFGDAPEVAAARALALDARCRATALDAAMTAPRADEDPAQPERSGDPALSASFEAAEAAARALIESDGLAPWLDLLVRERLGLLTAALGPAASADKAGAWRRAWELLSAAPEGHGSASARRSLAMAAGAGAPLVDAVEVLEREAAALDEEPGGRAALKAALSAAASRASLPLPAAVDAQEVDRARALLALARLDDLMTRWMSPQEALGGRLRVAILRRLGGRAGGLEALDAGYEGDLVELFSQARARRRDPEISALASVLDLLTEGDRGFDAQVEAAEGGQRALYRLLEALDHHGAGRSIDAAAALAGVDVEGAGDARAARLMGARALVAASIGQRRAALEALERADALAAGDAALDAMIDKVAARLMAVVVEAGKGGALLERAVRGRLIDEELPAPLWPWHTLGAALAPSGAEAVVLGALERSERLERGPEAAQGRRRALLELARGAAGRGDYGRARHFMTLTERLREEADEGLRAH